MKTRFLMLLAALLLGSASAFAQSGNNEPLKGDVNGDGKVDVADITAVIKIMKDGGGTSEETTYYWYLGYDQDLYDNTSACKSKMFSTSTNNLPSSYTRASGKKYSIPGNTPNYLIMAIPSNWSEPFVSNPAGGTIGLSKEKTNVTIDGISGLTFDVYSTPSEATIREVYIDPRSKNTIYWYVGFDFAIESHRLVEYNVFDLGHRSSMAGYSTSYKTWPVNVEITSQSGYCYIIAPKSWIEGYTKFFKDANGATPIFDKLSKVVSFDPEFEINGVTYTVYVSNNEMSAGTKLTSITPAN